MPATGATDEPCLCGTGNTYGTCCEPLHLGAAAPTAERLMRSRYSAFCLHRIDYLLATLHSSQRQPGDRAALLGTLASTEWVGLRILERHRGAADDASGEVEFVAHYCENGSAGRLHERSRFLKEDGRWFYHSGNYDNLSPPPRPGRNEPCWCGSGKKYKKCHRGQ